MWVRADQLRCQLQALDASIGPNTTVLPQAACKMWRDLRHANDPERANTLETTFQTQSPATVSDDCTAYHLQPGTALWDAGTLRGRPFPRPSSRCNASCRASSTASTPPSGSLFQLHSAHLQRRQHLHFTRYRNQREFRGGDRARRDLE